ncbi:MAG TPA: acyltransferase [Pseudonocardia sp.]|uniref:acyltransferase family protein n=1 Tax=Pseudonocardia sp. TaxID=60912 RepID=UPI002BC180E5|nr:acyltransferase [Pseudonocardia sp.]HTF52065.1 acyltransferase [Pseudonocardia sp.]
MANNLPVAPDAAQALAAATPVDRDRYADLLRLFSITMVALGHWVVALLTLHGAGPVSTSLPVMLTTWVWQVMALFFFVGGFAHARALRHRPPPGDFIRARVSRLLPPVVAMLAIWAGLAGALDVSGLATGQLAVGLHRITVPLWFLGVYLLIVLAAPTMMRLHLRFGLWRVAGALAVAAAAVDSVALGAGVPLVGYANLVFVWLAVHQLGFGYADGTLARGGRRLAAALALGGLAGTVLLVFGTSVYPVLMVGLPGNEVANSSPPTLALLTQSLFLVGLALLLRPAGTALANRPRTWFVVATGNTVIMTIFCWHLTACYLVQGALLLGSVHLPAADTPVWLLVLPGWLAACALVCVGLVAVFRRFERARPPASVGTGAAVVGVFAAAVGLFAVSGTGLDGLVGWRAETAAGGLPSAWLALGLVAAGVALLRGRRRLGSRP